MKVVGIAFVLAVLGMIVAYDIIGVPGAKLAHFVEELIGGALAFTVAVISYKHFTRTNQKYYMIISLAFFAGGLVDIIHGFLGYGVFLIPLSEPSVFIPGTWVAGRILLSLVLLFNLKMGDEKAYDAERGSEFALWGSMIAGLTLVLFAVFAFFKMPAFVLPDFPLIHRPWELVALAFFLISFRYYYKKGSAPEATPLQKMMVLSIAVGIFVQVFMTNSILLFDGLFNFAHIMKDISYLLPALVIFAMGMSNNISKDVEAKPAEVVKEK